MSAPFVTVLKDQFALLFFREFRPQLSEFWLFYLGWGLFTTWLVGVGRYWDHPNADAWQYAGLGSLTYVFVLSAIIWLLAMPLKPENLSYRNILIFVTLTSLPAILYAIPVERFMSLKNAQTTNIWFLAVVATWRVALYFVFLQRVAKFGSSAVAVITLLPLTIIVTTLAALNLEHAIFDLMGGIRDETANDHAFGFLFVISFFSVCATPIFLIWYAVLVYNARKSKGE